MLALCLSTPALGTITPVLTLGMRALYLDAPASGIGSIALATVLVGLDAGIRVLSIGMLALRYASTLRTRYTGTLHRYTSTV